MSMTNVTGLLLACFVGNSLNIDFFALLQKDLSKGMSSLAEGFFKQNYCHARRTRCAVLFPPPSCCLNSLLFRAKTSSLLNDSVLSLFKQIEEEQAGLLTIVKGFIDDIQMEFGLDKCSKAKCKKGKLTTTENIQIDVDTTIQELEQEGAYKYLGGNEGDGIQQAKMKKKIKKESYRRVRMVF